MTYPGELRRTTYHPLNSAATNAAPVAAEPYSHATPHGVAAADVRQEAIQSLEDLASSGRSLAELLEEAKRLVSPGKPEPNVMIGEKSKANAEPPLAGKEQQTNGGQLNRAPETANSIHRSRHNTAISKGAWIRVLAALAATVIGLAFGYVVARNDRFAQILFSSAVALGLLPLFLNLSSHMRRRKRRRA